MKLGIGLIVAGAILAVLSLTKMVVMRMFGAVMVVTSAPLVITLATTCCTLLLTWGALRIKESIKKAKKEA